MKLHKIMFKHYAPKDSEEGIRAYVLAVDEKTILQYVSNLTGGVWADRMREDGPLEIHDEDYEVIGTETVEEHLLRFRGDMEDPVADTSDAYYGVTLWGWDEGVEISDEDAAVLLRLGIAEDWRDPPAPDSEEAEEEEEEEEEEEDDD